MAIYRELRLRRVLKAIPREETIAPMAKSCIKNGEVEGGDDSVLRAESDSS
jgi:hypothetical protein